MNMGEKKLEEEVREFIEELEQRKNCLLLMMGGNPSNESYLHIRGEVEGLDYVLNKLRERVPEIYYNVIS